MAIQLTFPGAFARLKRSLCQQHHISKWPGPPRSTGSSFHFRAFAPSLGVVRSCHQSARGASTIVQPTRPSPKLEECYLGGCLVRL